MPEENNKTCRLVSIVNQKGGVGKSTTAINISAYLANSGASILLVDLDPQGNATSGLGIYKKDIRNSVYDVIADHNRIAPEEAIFNTVYEGLDILPSSEKLSGAEVELVSAFKREYRLKKVLDKLKQYYDYILVDCSPALGLLTINALTATIEVIIPLQCEYFAFGGIANLLQTVELVRKNLNSGLEISGIVLTMYTKTKLSNQVVKEAKKYFSGRVFKTIVPRNVRLAEAPSFGKHIFAYDPECKGAKAYEKLTKEFIKNRNGDEKRINIEIENLSRRMKDFWDTGAPPKHAFGR
jgi:chromosome partitioning protein